MPEIVQDSVGERQPAVVGRLDPGPQAPIPGRPESACRIVQAGHLQGVLDLRVAPAMGFHMGRSKFGAEAVPGGADKFGDDRLTRRFEMPARPIRGRVDREPDPGGRPSFDESHAIRPIGPAPGSIRSSGGDMSAAIMKDQQGAYEARAMSGRVTPDAASSIMTCGAGTVIATASNGP